MNEDSNCPPFFASRLSRGETVWIAAVALLYFVTARFSLLLVFQPEGIAAIWPPSGIFLSAILLTRRSVRPYLVAALLLTDFIAELLTGTPLFVSAIYALELSSDAVLSSWLLLRFVGEPMTFRKVRDVVWFLALAIILSNGLLSLGAAAASILIPGTSFWSSWKWWTISTGIGNLLVTPFILSWASWAKSRLGTWNPKRVLEIVVLFLLLVLVNFFSFQYLSSSYLFSLLLPYLSFPFLLWAALRFEVRGVTSVLILMAAIAVPFVAMGRVVGFYDSSLGNLITLQLYLVIMAVPSLFLAAVVTDRKQAEEKVRTSMDFLDNIINATGYPIFVKDDSFRFALVNNALCDMLGIERENIIGKTLGESLPKDQMEHFLKVDKMVFDSGLENMCEELLTGSSGKILDIVTIKKRFVDQQGNKFLVGVIYDLTERKKAEEKIQASLKEKEVMLQEIHHRVKNNLQVISSLLNMQSCYLQDEKAREALRESMFRVRTMAMIHTQLYQSQDLTRVDFGLFIRDLIGNISQSYGKTGSPVEIKVDAPEISLGIDASIPCGLILNELVSNALEHAFPEGKEGEINIRMRSEANRVMFTVQDNGIGFPEAIDIMNLKSLGLELVNILVKQINGQIDMQVEGGTTWTITFPIKSEREWRNG